MLIVRNLIIFILDSLSIALALYGAFYLRLSVRFLEPQHMSLLLQVLPFLMLIQLASNFLFRLHRISFYFVSLPDLIQIIKASSFSAVLTAGMVFIFQLTQFPRSVIFLYLILSFLLLSGYRISLRIILYQVQYQKNRSAVIKVLIYGAGQAGDMLARDLLRQKNGQYQIIGFLDDNPNRHHSYIQNIPVLGGQKHLSSILKKYLVSEILLAIPSSSSQEFNEVIRSIKSLSSDIKVKSLPSIHHLLEKGKNVLHLQDVKEVDLLAREQIEFINSSEKNYLEEKVILITGAAGSIGSEITRQCLFFKPKKIVCLDWNENGIFFLQQELSKIIPSVEIEYIVGSVQDAVTLNSIFEKNKIHVVFHAAAFKHVPLMEDHPLQAIENNVFGTYQIAKISEKNHVQKFVFISTDKAVNPKNVMGKSKQAAEEIINHFSKQSSVSFIIVRFGNVLGSNGSVIPIFKKQIEAGGPVTVTDPECTRFFMTIPEAVQLVIQSGALSKESAIYFLDMGKPVKIVDLAKNLIQLSGLTIDKDIKIVFTGLRPGEKLHEILYPDEFKDFVSKTKHEKILKLENISKKYDLQNLFSFKTKSEFCEYFLRSM